MIFDKFSSLRRTRYASDGCSHNIFIWIGIIAVYIDDLNLIGTPEELINTTNYLKKEFEVKDHGITRYCLGLQIEYFLNGV